MKLGRIILIGLALFLMSGPAWASPYATTLVDSGGTFGPSPYNDPASVLGAPATDFYDPWGSWSGGDNYRKVKLVEPAYNYAPDQTTKLITTLRNPSYIVVGFDHQVINDQNNPYGIDFLVFGNAFYVGSGFVNDETNMATYMLVGGAFTENVLVSVSQGPAYEGQPQNEWTWYTYSNGPYGDNAFPTQAYEWDQAKYDATGNGWTDDLMDFTKPVNPAYYDTLMAGGLSGAAGIALYEGSGGGTGFDLDVFGLDWIQYIKVEGTADFKEGEIDAFADVAPVPVPGAVLLLGGGLLRLMAWRRRTN
ncbi:hypothetical protein [Desulfobacca acetoxidans]|uniref:PEP motif anchor domain protein n=1 Tax=Desulfobacca acetoxidans (strain ATCC 700848 / DSM 11109 / ASRB2) TaxID=880072 RepID=F2NFA0_DESAR|nr:hypothetical protein [Desulfobacca acetoxidans]AEB08655.1 hypothetical protein Desac_0776 [Desulfobacca acetoxidans DSM 11109]